MLKRLLALSVLGLALLKTLVSRWSRAQPALEQFADTYGREGLLAVTPEERLLLDEAGRCTTCGRCDRGELERVVSSGGAYRGLMYFAQSGFRSMPDYRFAAAQIEHVPEAALIAAQEQCPTGVPLVALARLVRQHAGRS